MDKVKFTFMFDEESHRDDGRFLEEKFKNGIEAEDEDEAEAIVEKVCKENSMNVPYYSVVED